MIKKVLFRVLVLTLTFFVLGLSSILVVYRIDLMNFTPDFFETSEEIAWAEEVSSREIDFYNEPWTAHYTLTISEKNRRYVSPKKRYQLVLKAHENEANISEGFYIADIETGRVVLDSDHWVIHPSEVKWLFDEKYIVYWRSEDDFIGVQQHYVYVGSLKTGEVARLTTTKPFQYLKKHSAQSL